MSGIRDIGGAGFGADLPGQGMPNGYSAYIHSRTGSLTLPLERQPVVQHLMLRGFNPSSIMDVFKYYSMRVGDDDVFAQQQGLVDLVRESDNVSHDSFAPYLQDQLKKPHAPLVRDLHLDLLATVRSSRDTDILDIAFSRPSTLQVRDWFLNADPLNESHRLMIGDVTNRYNLADQAGASLVGFSMIRQCVYAYAVERLVNDIYARALLPDSYHNYPLDWRSQFVKEYISKLPQIQLSGIPIEDFVNDPQTYIPEHFFTAAIFSHVRSGALTQSQLDAILLAQEIDVYFANRTKAVVNDQAPDFKRAVQNEGDQAVAFVRKLNHISIRQQLQFGERQLIASLFIGTLAHDISRPEKTHRELEGFTNQQAMVLLQMQLIQASSTGGFAQLPDVDSVMSLTAVTSSASEFLDKLVLSNGESRADPNQPNVSKAELKGMVHEVVWYLDMRILAHLNAEEGLGIKVASAREDFPTLGSGLSHRRSFDISIFAQDTCPVYVQLKSGSGKRKWEKQYHPAITVVEEQNFMLVEKRALAAHLKTIELYMQAGAPREGELADKMREKILPSVKETLELFNRRRELSAPRIHTLDVDSYQFAKS